MCSSAAARWAGAACSGLLAEALATSPPPRLPDALRRGSPAQEEAAALIADWTQEEMEYLRDEVPRQALRTPFRGGTVQDLAKQVGKKRGAVTGGRGWQQVGRWRCPRAEP